MKIVHREVSNVPRRSVPIRRAAAFDRLMKISYPPGERIDVSGRELVALERVTGQTVLGKLSHSNGIFDRCAGALENRIGGRATNGDEIEIELRREAPVQAQFVHARLQALAQGGEVDKSVIDRFLDLVGEIPSEEDMRDVRLDCFDLARGVRETMG